MCKIPNLPLEEIDPKCREFVYLLNKYGFKTQFSCQGHYNGDKRTGGNYSGYKTPLPGTC